MTTAHVLNLYRSILRHGLTLKYTDKIFYKRFIRGEFDKSKNLSDKEKIQQCIKVITNKLYIC